MDWLLAVSYWRLAIETIGAIRVIGSLILSLIHISDYPDLHVDTPQ